MARNPRIQYKNAWYHVMNRGAQARSIFKTKRHYVMFIELLEKISEIYDIEIHAYCLMSNHYHLLVKTPDGNISRGMKYLNQVYVQRFNKSEEIDGLLVFRRVGDLSSDGILSSIQNRKLLNSTKDRMNFEVSGVRTGLKQISSEAELKKLCTTLERWYDAIPKDQLICSTPSETESVKLILNQIEEAQRKAKDHFSLSKDKNVPLPEPIQNIYDCCKCTELTPKAKLELTLSCVKAAQQTTTNDYWLNILSFIEKITVPVVKEGMNTNKISHLSELLTNMLKLTQELSTKEDQQIQKNN